MHACGDAGWQSIGKRFETIRVDEADVSRLLELVRLNISAMVELTYRVLPDMLARGKARCRSLANGQPTSAYLLETEKTQLPMGQLQANIRNTRANYATSRRLVDTLLSGRRAPKMKGGWGSS